MFLLGAVSANTRRTYVAGARHYREFCAETGADAAAMTAGTLCEWLTRLGTEGRLAPGTLTQYRSAVSLWFVETVRDDRRPFDAKVVSRVFEGVSRHLTALRLAVAPTPKSLELTPALLEEIRHRLLPAWATPAHRMRWTAYLVAVHGLLRPNEFLGAYRQFDRALRVSQLAFFNTLNQPVDPLRYPGPYARVELALGVTKADPAGKNAPLPLSNPDTLRALVGWLRERQRIGEARPLLFICPGMPRSLSGQTCYTELTTALIAQGYAAPYLTGRCFRRGGASALVAQGAPLAAIQAAGRWKSAAMVDRYASEDSKRKRDQEQPVSASPAPRR